LAHASEYGYRHIMPVAVVEEDGLILDVAVAKSLGATFNRCRTYRLDTTINVSTTSEFVPFFVQTLSSTLGHILSYRAFRSKFSVVERCGYALGREIPNPDTVEMKRVTVPDMYIFPSRSYRCICVHSALCSCGTPRVTKETTVCPGFVHQSLDPSKHQTFSVLYLDDAIVDDPAIADSPKTMWTWSNFIKGVQIAGLTVGAVGELAFGHTGGQNRCWNRMTGITMEAEHLVNVRRYDVQLDFVRTVSCDSRRKPLRTGRATDTDDIWTATLNRTDYNAATNKWKTCQETFEFSMGLVKDLLLRPSQQALLSRSWTSLSSITPEMLLVLHISLETVAALLDRMRPKLRFLWLPKD
jgi:hypothetical protein